MTEEEIRRAVSDCDPTLLDELAVELEAKVRAPYRVAAQLLSDGDLAGRAKDLIGGGAELGAAALADGDVTVDPKWCIETALAGEKRLREQVDAWLISQLDNRAELPIFDPNNPLDMMEVPPPSERACDRAYLMLRALRCFGENALDRAELGEAFLYLTAEQKDRVIAKARDSDDFRQSLDDMDDDVA